MSEEIESTVTGDKIEETPKLSARDAIFANREDQLLDEVGEIKEEVEGKETVIEETKPGTVKVKIDGVEEERSIDDLIRSYQKSEAGDRRLQLAAQELKRVEDERLRFEQERQQFEQEKQRSVEIKEPDLTLEELKHQRLEALEIGDYNEFDRLDEEVNSYRISKSKPQYDEKQIITAAKEQALTQIQYESALESFKNENKLLFQDNVLYNITMSTFNNMCQESSTYQEAFEKTGRLVKEWIGSVAPERGVSAMTDRVERKQSIPDEPGRLNAKSTPPPAKKEETASDIITNMRKARGLPV